jgi:membrane fusion protein (multidrug efflux system)
MKAHRSKFTGVVLLTVAVLAGGAYLFVHRNDESTDDAALNGHTVTLSSKVAGYVKTLNINDNQWVKAGDLLLEIEPTDYRIRRDRAQAQYEAAEAAFQASQRNRETTDISAPSNLDAAETQVASAAANWDKALKDLQRMQRLSNEARSQQQLDQAVASEKVLKSALDEAHAKFRIAKTAPKAMAAAQAVSRQLAAQFKQAQADLAQAQYDLANTKVIAPMDGKITNRGVERGNYVQPGQQLGSLVGAELWVVANFKETQLEHIRPGQPATISIDAFPDVTLEGKVDSIQSGTGAFFSAFPPQNATGNFVKIVQRVPVKIVLNQPPDASLALGPGMSVVPTVDTAKD